MIFVETNATMTKIIPINNSPDLPITHTYVQGGWILSYNVFWLNDHLPRAEVSYAEKAIEKLINPTASDSIFLCFIEKLLLSYKLIRNDTSKWIDLPSLWFNPQFSEGFSSLDNIYTAVREKREKVKEYQKGIKVFSRNYLQYIKDPSNKILKRCHYKLLQLREYDLLQLWNNVIIHLHIKAV